MEYMARKLKEEYEKWRLAINLEKTKYACMGEGKETLKFDGGEEIKPCTECTYLGTKIDQWGDNTTFTIFCTKKSDSLSHTIHCLLNPLQTKRILLYLKTQYVPCCKHFSSRL